jgi:hypothetical protein
VKSFEKEASLSNDNWGQNQVLRLHLPVLYPFTFKCDTNPYRYLILTVSGSPYQKSYSNHAMTHGRRGLRIIKMIIQERLFYKFNGR